MSENPARPQSRAGLRVGIVVIGRKRPGFDVEWGRQMAYINHFYFYLWDSEWGGAFWKTNAYAPYPIWLWLNGHEWAKRQVEKAGIGYEALDNGFRSCTDPAALQNICEQLEPAAVQSFLARWVRRWPSPFTDADWRAGYRYELAFRQFEVSDTRVFDRPPAGRMWFESVIRDVGAELHNSQRTGRPEKVGGLGDAPGGQLNMQEAGWHG